MSLVWPLPRISSGHNPFSPWLPLWGSCHEVTERVKNALSAPSRGTSPIGRGKTLIRHGCAVPPSPEGKALGVRIVTGGNPWKGPHQCAHWFAMTYVYFGAQWNNTKLAVHALAGGHAGLTSYDPR